MSARGDSFAICVWCVHSAQFNSFKEKFCPKSEQLVAASSERAYLLLLLCGDRESIEKEITYFYI